ncbi:MAG TPA: Ig-like domain-containing protein, partial [Acidobacteriaceae bacterium]|nr:Ig-like domain-containing protein [Acidobacteriaceae bacterium]
VAVTVNQASTTMTLVANGGSANPGSTVTLTATVAPQVGGTPTGTVDFYDGSTLLGSGTLASAAAGAAATFSTTALSSGSHSISATYAGDTNFTGSTANLQGGITVSPLSLTMTATPGAQSGTAGGTFTYQLAVAPAFAGTPYPAAVTFAAIGGPAGATISFSPSSLNASDGPKTVTMSVATPVKSAALHPESTGRPLVPVALAFLLLPLAGTKRMRRNGQKLGRFVCLLLLALAGVVATTALSGCGSGSGGATKINNATQYTITVTATSGTVAQSATVTLTLQ